MVFLNGQIDNETTRRECMNTIDYQKAVTFAHNDEAERMQTARNGILYVCNQFAWHYILSGGKIAISEVHRDEQRANLGLLLRYIALAATEYSTTLDDLMQADAERMARERDQAAGRVA